MNLLMLAGSLFRLQVYDRVLSSRAVQTLTLLSAQVVFQVLMMTVLDLGRACVLAWGAAGIAGVCSRASARGVDRRALQSRAGAAIQIEPFPTNCAMRRSS